MSLLKYESCNQVISTQENFLPFQLQAFLSLRRERILLCCSVKESLTDRISLLRGNSSGPRLRLLTPFVLRLVGLISFGFDLFLSSFPCVVANFNNSN